MPHLHAHAVKHPHEPNGARAAVELLSSFSHVQVHDEVLQRVGDVPVQVAPVQHSQPAVVGGARGGGLGDDARAQAFWTRFKIRGALRL